MYLGKNSETYVRTTTFCKQLARFAKRKWNCSTDCGRKGLLGSVMKREAISCSEKTQQKNLKLFSP